MLERAHLRVRTLRQMVSELLELTAMQAGRFQIHRQAVDVRPARLTYVAERGVGVTFLPPGADWFPGDPCAIV